MGEVVIVLFFLSVVFIPLISVWLSILGVIHPTEEQVMAFILAYIFSLFIIGSMDSGGEDEK